MSDLGRIEYLKAITAAERLFSGVDDLVWLRRGSVTRLAAGTWILPEVLQQLRDDVLAGQRHVGWPVWPASELPQGLYLA